MSQLTFLGAAQTVTGSKYLLEHGSVRLLIDCGLFQGLKSLRERNWAALPVPPASIDAVILTHAHLDHTGYLPRLVAGGFRGRIFCTAGTKDLCQLVLPDAGRLQEEDARTANRRGYTRHRPALPLFTEGDAFRALELLQPVGFERAMPVAPGVEVTFRHMGHLLGAAAVIMELRDPARTIVFGGDLGRYDRPVLRDPEPIAEADVLLVESTYGDRRHEPGGDEERMAALVTETIGRGGRLIIPSFAIGRVEEVLYWLKRLEDERRIPRVPVYLDSPMSIQALEYYTSRHDELDDEFRDAAKPARRFETSRFTCVTSGRESEELAASNDPAIVISSSGMATGGRVLNHLERALPDPRNTVLFVGFQAAGTRGRTLIEGAKQVKIHGVSVAVGAQVAQIESMSAHADAGEILRWLRGFTRPPQMTYVVHGEPPAMTALMAAIGAELGDGWKTRAPGYMETADLLDVRTAIADEDRISEGRHRS
jgi:metallo-beta-lactamase family protein